MAPSCCPPRVVCVTLSWCYLILTRFLKLKSNVSLLELVSVSFCIFNRFHRSARYSLILTVSCQKDHRTTSCPVQHFRSYRTDHWIFSCNSHVRYQRRCNYRSFSKVLVLKLWSSNSIFYIYIVLINTNPLRVHRRRSIIMIFQESGNDFLFEYHYLFYRPNVSFSSYS